MARKKRPLCRPNAGGSLILHPKPEAIRRDHIKAYRKQAAALKSANTSLKNLDEVEIPAFRAWLDLEFSSEREAFLLVTGKIGKIESFVEAANLFRDCRKGTFAQAYTKIKEAYEAGNLPLLMDDIVKELNDKASSARKFDREEDDFFRDLFGDDDLDDDEFSHEDSDDFGHDGFYQNDFEGPKRHARGHDYSTKDKHQDGHFKTLYRQLVKKLHPDFCPNQTPVEVNLWHELQSAFEWNDLTKLEEIHRAINGAAAADANIWKLPLGEIVRMKADLAKKLRSSKERLAFEKTQDSWDFTRRSSQKSYVARLSRQIGQSLRFELQMAEMTLQELERDVARRCAPRKKSNKKGVSKKSAKSQITPKGRRSGFSSHEFR